MLFFLFFLFFVYSIFPQIIPSIKQNPSLKWYSIKTKHFNIHYHKELEYLVDEFANIAEKTHRKFSKRLNWTPFFRTEIVLSDKTDLSNGFALPIPYNFQYLYIAPPDIASNLGYFKNWLEILFIHEYTHTLTLDTAYGFSQAIHYIFGRYPIFGFMNLAQPIWILEGIAVHQESINGLGRNYNNYTDMIMRIEFLNSKERSITDASFFISDWPAGAIPYLYGGRFIQFLEEKYGDNSFTKIIHEQAGNIWPFQVKDNIQNVYHIDVEILWYEWQREQLNKYKKQFDLVRQKTLTKYSLLTKSGFRTGLPRFNNNGQKLFYIRDSNSERTTLMSIEFSAEKKWDDKKHDLIGNVNLVRSISVDRDDTIYLSDIELYQNYSLYQEIFHYSPNRRQISENLRAYYIDSSPQNDKIVFIRFRSGRYSLVLSDPKLNGLDEIIPNSEWQMDYCRFSPDGSQVAFSFKDKKNYTGIAVIDLKTKRITQLIRDQYRNVHPEWHPSQKKILFSSDRNGIYNLYEIYLNSNQMIQVTNIIGGFFSPDIDPSGEWVAVSSYEENGFNIGIMPYPTKNYSQIKYRKKEIKVSDFQKREDFKKSFSINDYSPFSSIWPTFWGPSSISNDPSGRGFNYTLFTLGFDVLMVHSYSILFSHTVKPSIYSLFDIDLSYTYRGLWPNISFLYGSTLVADHTPSKSLDILREASTIATQSTGIIVSLPFLSFKYSHILSFSSFYVDDNLGDLESKRVHINKTNVQYTYRDISFYSTSISPEDGRVLLARSTLSGTLPVLDTLSHTYVLRYLEYLPGFFKNNVTLIALLGGLTIENGVNHDPFLSNSVRGFIDNVEGNKLIAATLEYRFPLLRLETGYYDILPFLIKDISMLLFFDYGHTWEENVHISDFKKSIGSEISLRIRYTYQFTLTAILGYAYSFDQKSIDDQYRGIFYFRIAAGIPGLSTSNRHEPEITKRWKLSEFIREKGFLN